MESENFEDITEAFQKIDIEDEPDSEKYENPWKVDFKPQPTLRYIPKPHIDFEKYVRENCGNKIQILNRETFHQIKRPIVIFFNHFNERCAYHTKWLDGFYEVALKYGDRIDFIAADLKDIDVIYPGTNSYNHFCRLVRPEDESPNTFAIDEKKRITNNLDCYRNLDSIWELCENLLNGKLFPSLPIPENNDKNLIKICVHDNYEELILKSSKNIFLIVNLECYQQCEPNYENVALALKDYNLDILYMEAEKNYIPFEYNIGYYPTLLFIPHNDKKNFIYYEDRREEEDLKEFLLKVVTDPEFLKLKQKEVKERMLKKSVQVSEDFEIDYHNELPRFLQENFDDKFKILDRKTLENSKRCHWNILIFMDFPDMKCQQQHINWLNQIYQVAERSYTFNFYIADFKDIDIINTKWNPQELRSSSQGKPKIYALDFQQHSFALENFDNLAKLFHFTVDLQSRRLYYSEVYSRKYMDQPVNVWTADRFNIFLKKSEKHIFLTFYSSEDENCDKLFKVLEQIAEEVKDLNVEVAKFNVLLNYVDLEFVQDQYPVHYFIPKNNKKCNKIFRDQELSKEKMLEFIRGNLDNK